VRDEVDDAKPTEWNLWTLSDKLQLRPRRADVIGTYGVDMTVQFFVGPDETPTTEMLSFGVGRAQAKPVMQQNVIRMSSDKGGSYGAVLYPYRPNEKRPGIAAGEHAGVTITGDGNDLVLVYPNERAVDVGDIAFVGQAGVVIRAGGRTELHLVEGRSLKRKDGYGLEGRGPATISINDKATIEVRTDGEARELEVLLPAQFAGRLVPTAGAKQLKSEPGRLTVLIDAGPQTLVVER
jgi:hypothetical protein